MGDDSGEGTPVPIPNTVVKLSSPDDTAGAALWENWTLPTFLRTAVRYAIFVVDGITLPRPLEYIPGGFVVLGRRQLCRLETTERHKGGLVFVGGHLDFYMDDGLTWEEVAVLLCLLAVSPVCPLLRCMGASHVAVLLRLLGASPGLLGGARMVYNPKLDRMGQYAQRITQLLVDVFGALSS